MEVFGVVIPTWLMLAAVFLLFVYYYGTSSFDAFSKRGIPGPHPLPFVGTMHQLAFASTPMLNDVNTAKYGRIYGLFFGMQPYLIINDHELVKDFTVRQFSNFPDRMDSTLFSHPIFKGSVTQTKGDHWKHVRGQLAPVFTSGKLKEMQPLIDVCTDKLVSFLESQAGNDVPLRKHTGAFTMSVIASTGFGITLSNPHEDGDNDPFQRHGKQFMSGLNLANPIVLMQVLFPKLNRIMEFFGYGYLSRATCDFFKKAVREKLTSSNKDSTRRDFVHQALLSYVDLEKESKDYLRSSQSDTWSVKGLTETEILSNAMLFFVAGYETTADLLQFVLYSLAVEDGIQDRLREEVMSECGEEIPSYEQLMKLDYLEWVINETQRLYPAAGSLDRVCVKDTVLGGYDIPKGMIVGFSPWSMGRDPEYWDDPLTFKPERFSPENRPDNLQYIWLPFGVGPRGCIGMRLALLEAKGAIARIVQRFHIKTTERTPMKPLEFKRGQVFLTSLVPLSLRFIPRSE